MDSYNSILKQFMFYKKSIRKLEKTTISGETPITPGKVFKSQYQTALRTVDQNVGP